MRLTVSLLLATLFLPSVGCRKELEPQRVSPGLESLVGKPAPELDTVKAWKNGGPLTWNDLRGRRVVVDFRASWCGPCVGEMPGLMSLHGDFKDEYLVIMALHDASVKSLEESEAKLGPIRGK